MRLWIVALVLVVGTMGCDKNEKASVPDNPVPMVQPGSSAEPGAGTKGKKNMQQPKGLQ